MRWGGLVRWVGEVGGLVRWVGEVGFFSFLILLASIYMT